MSIKIPEEFCRKVSFVNGSWDCISKIVLFFVKNIKRNLCLFVNSLLNFWKNFLSTEKVDFKPQSSPYFKTEVVHLYDFELQHVSYIVQVHLQDICVFRKGRNESSSAVQQRLCGHYEDVMAFPASQPNLAVVPFGTITLSHLWNIPGVPSLHHFKGCGMCLVALR